VRSGCLRNWREFDHLRQKKRKKAHGFGVFQVVGSVWIFWIYTPGLRKIQKNRGFFKAKINKYTEIFHFLGSWSPCLFRF
jgi:hypothetical protein